jgi:multimeric flavodoxin WrbA/putative sterol carrier protein
VKVLILTAYPRRDGFTRYCTDFFIKGVRDSGAEFATYDVTRAGIHPCKGCFGCWCATPGRCVQNDGMAELLDAYLGCDAFVIATPLYGYGVSGWCKIYLERTLPLLTPGVTYSAGGVDRNLLRYPDRGPRSMAAIVVGGLGARSLGDGALASLRLYADGMNLKFAGALVRNESYLLQFTDTKPKTIKTIETAFEQAGRMFALDGTIAPDLIEKAATPLSINPDRFQMYSNIYWEHAQRVFARGGTMEEVRILTRSDVRILMQEMVAAVDPVTTVNVRAVVRFNFTDSGSVYTIFIERGSARLEAAATGARVDLTISCTSAVWTGIVHRTTDPMKALTTGELRLEGDKELFRKFGRFFPPPNL